MAIQSSATPTHQSWTHARRPPDLGPGWYTKVPANMPPHSHAETTGLTRVHTTNSAHAPQLQLSQSVIPHSHLQHTQTSPKSTTRSGAQNVHAPHNVTQIHNKKWRSKRLHVRFLTAALALNEIHRLLLHLVVLSGLDPLVSIQSSFCGLRVVGAGLNHRALVHGELGLDVILIID